jgi:hypothetical protein
MGKKLKIFGVFIVVVIALVIAAAVAASSIGTGNLSNANPGDITGVTQFYVIKDGSLYKVRFSLTDKNNNAVSNDAKVNFVVNSNNGNPIFKQNFDVKANDFKEYHIILTGAPILAYMWQINGTALSHNQSYFPKAILTLTIPNGKSFSTDQSIT